MDVNFTQVRGLSIHAVDGVIGKVNDVYFDDLDWTVRYLVVDTGHWLTGRQVLISPHSLGTVDLAKGELMVSLTMDKVQHSPDVDTHRPVSRQYEQDLSAYYGYPYYWDGPGVWGIGAYPGSVIAEGRWLERERPQRVTVRTLEDSHLRSAAAVLGHHLHATDGDIGHVVDLRIDDHSWSVITLVVEAGHWWSGHRVDISPRDIADIDWVEARVAVTMSRQDVKDAPAASAPS